VDIAPNIRTVRPGRFQDLAPRAPDALEAAGPVIRSRYRGPTVSLYEWHCGGHGAAHPVEEWADAHEVVIPRRGAFEWQIAGARVLADPGSATFLHPAEPYRVRHPLPGGDAGSVFRLTPDGVRALVGEHDRAAAERPRARFPRSHVPLDGRTYLLHRLAVRAAADPGAGGVEVEERAVAFLRAAMAQAYRTTAPAVRRERAVEAAARVSEVVAARYREPLTLVEIARVVGLSPFHLSRLVTAATGVPIYRMIIRRRLRDALELLLETREGITAIALAVGFASHSHLTDAFRREYGVPPRAVRRRAAAVATAPPR
jgi:AraC family transcriptional regulator